MILWAGEYRGRLPRINRKYGSRCIGGKGRVYVTAEYRSGTEAMAAAFAGPQEAITDAVDVYIQVSMWSRLDSDAPIKAIFDALEKAQVLKDDKQVHDFFVYREYHPRDAEDRVSVTIADKVDRPAAVEGTWRAI